MQHTYFMKTMDWIAEGTYYGNGGETYPLHGEVSIIRSEAQWTLGGFLEVAYPAPARFTNDYTIKTSREDGTLEWESFNPDLGTLRGTFEIVGRYIVSTYMSKDGSFSGTETLIQVDENTYDNVGVSYHNGVKMSSWTARITAINEGGR